jgi:hypothetical protein
MRLLNMDEGATTGPILFCFAMSELIEQSTGSYDAPALKSTLNALATHRLATELRNGDLLLHVVAERIGQVSTVPLGRAKRLAMASRVHVDRDLLITLAWDVMDSATERWNAGAVEALASLLAKHDGFGIALAKLPRAVADDAACKLEGTPGYVCAFETDIGNPHHVSLCSFLPTRGWISDSEFLFDRYLTDDPFDPPMLENWTPWLSEVPFTGRYLDDSERAALGDWPEGPVSSRGAESAALLASRTPDSHLDRVTKALLDGNRKQPEFEFSVDVTALPHVADAVIEESKLRGYALNVDHPDGGDKARHFQTSLDIGADDWQYLAAQLKEGLATAHTHRVRANQYGVSYHCVVEVVGLNGRRRPVLCAWQIKSNGAPRLVTAYIDRSKGPPEPREGSAILSQRLSGAQRFEALYELADDRATQRAMATVPTPLSVDGQWYPEGALGSAWVVVPDLRTGFARWLVRSDRAHAQRGRGALVFSPYAGLDQSDAYAQEFAGVLRLNGLDCEVITHPS